MVIFYFLKLFGLDASVILKTVGVAEKKFELRPKIFELADSIYQMAFLQNEVQRKKLTHK